MKVLSAVWAALKWVFSLLSPFVHDKVEPAIAAAIKEIQDEAATKAAAVKAEAAAKVADLTATHSVQTVQDQLKADLAAVEAAYNQHVSLLKAAAEARTKNATSV